MFPLLNLPFVAIRQALQSMSSWEIYQLSLCSVKMRNWIISTGDRKEIHCWMELNKSVTFNFDYPLKIEYEEGSGVLRRLKIQEMQELFDFRHYGLRVEGKRRFDYNDRNGFEWSYQKLAVHMYTDNISQENAQFLFTNPNIDSIIIYDYRDSIPPTPYTGAVIIPRIQLWRCDHLSLDAILNMETTDFSARYSTMKAEDVNRLLKTWKEGMKLREMESFVLRFRTRFHPTDVEIMIRGTGAEKEEKHGWIYYRTKRGTDGRVATLNYNGELVVVMI